MDTNHAILIGIGILAAAHVLASISECLTTERRNALEDAATACATLKKLAGQYPPGTDIAVTVGGVTVQVATPEPEHTDEGDEWKRV